MKKTWWRHLWSTDNSTVNTGAVFAALGCLLTLVVIIVNEFVHHHDTYTNNRYLLLGIIALGGWGYASSLRNQGPGPPAGPPSKKEE
jgi:hypothetical protein